MKFVAGVHLGLRSTLFSGGGGGWGVCGLVAPWDSGGALRLRWPKVACFAAFGEDFGDARGAALGLGVVLAAEGFGEGSWSLAEGLAATAAAAAAGLLRAPLARFGVLRAPASAPPCPAASAEAAAAAASFFAACAAACAAAASARICFLSCLSAAWNCAKRSLIAAGSSLISAVLSPVGCAFILSVVHS